MIKLLSLLRRAPEPVNPGRELAKMGHEQRRALIRETAIQMQRDLAAKGIEVPARSRLI